MHVHSVEWERVRNNRRKRHQKCTKMTGECKIITHFVFYCRAALDLFGVSRGYFANTAAFCVSLASLLICQMEMQLSRNLFIVCLVETMGPSGCALRNHSSVCVCVKMKRRFFLFSRSACRGLSRRVST